MPFYKFGVVIYLKKIDILHWQHFITQQFNRTGKTISQDHAETIASAMKGHPNYVQQLSHIVWTLTTKTVNKRIIDEAINEIITQDAALFEKEIENLSNTQVYYLHALIDNVNNNISSAVNLKKYNLNSSANVVKIKEALTKKEIIEIQGGQAQFLDPVFELWLRRIYFYK